MPVAIWVFEQIPYVTRTAHSVYLLGRQSRRWIFDPAHHRLFWFTFSRVFLTRQGQPWRPSAMGWGLASLSRCVGRLVSLPYWLRARRVFSVLRLVRVFPLCVSLLLADGSCRASLGPARATFSFQFFDRDSSGQHLNELFHGFIAISFTAGSGSVPGCRRLNLQFFRRLIPGISFHLLFFSVPVCDSPLPWVDDKDVAPLVEFRPS